VPIIVTVKPSIIQIIRSAKPRVIYRTQKGDRGEPGNLGIADASDDLTLIVNTDYRVTDTDLVILSLPAAASRGDKIIVRGYGIGGWKIPVPAGKVIHILGGPNSTATDGTGYISSINQFDKVELECIVDNNEWAAETWGCDVKL
jgi:hypothetical protein